MNSAPTPTPDTGAPALSQVSRIANVFFSPSTTFDDIKRDTSWWMAWLLISVIAVVFAFSMQQKIGWEQVTKNDINASRMRTEQWEKATPEQRAAQLTIGSKATAGVWYGMPVIILLFSMLFAALYMATFNFGLGKELSFSSSLAVIFYASIPAALKWLLAVIVLYAGADPEAFDPQNPVATNLSFLPGFSRLEHPVLYAVATSFDLFRIWGMILTAIGFASVARVKRSTAAWVVAGWFAIGIALAAGITAIFS